MWLELKRAMFSKRLKQTMARPLPGFHGLLLYFLCSKNIHSPPVCGSNDTKISKFSEGMTQIFGKCSVIGMCLVIGIVICIILST
jgi:hypothetical protein